MRFWGTLFLALAIHASATGWDSLRVQVGPTQSASGIWSQKGSKAPRGLVVWLHGGMQSSKCEKGYEAGKALLPYMDKAGVVIASPSACMDRHWVTPQGLGAVEALIDTVFAHYNIDPKRIWLVGVSDGGYGVMNYSLQGKRALAKRVLISTFPGALVPLQDLAQVQQQLNVGRWIYLQGGADAIFPAAQTKPWIEGFCNQISHCELHWEPTGEHDMSWWNTNRADLLRQVFTAK